MTERDPGVMLDQAELWLSYAAGCLLSAIATAPAAGAEELLQTAEQCVRLAECIAEEVGLM